MIEVWHAKNFRASTDAAYGDGPALGFPADYIHVADVATDEIERAYELTNTIETYWWENDGVTAHKTETRSTSVGDVLVKGGQAYRCEIMGWREIERSK